MPLLLAFGAEQTRETYKEVVEPICKENSNASAKILKGVKQEVKAEKYAPASRQFAKAATALKKTYGELAGVSQPPADTAKLTKWLSLVKSEVGLFEKGAKILKGGPSAQSKAQLSQLQVKIQTTATQANREVVSFEFHYCNFEPQKYT